MIKITLNDVVSNLENIKALQDIKFPVKVSYKIMRLVNKLNPIYTIYEEKRNALVKEYADAPDEQGNVRVTDPEKLKLFSEKLKELLETTDDVDFEPISVTELGNVEVESKLLVPFIFID